jgi:fatty acid desaturase
MTATQTVSSRRIRFDRQNLAVLGAQCLAWWLLLEALHGDLGIAWKAILLALWCLVMQGVFSMMHECFHRSGHRRPRLNGAMGVLASTLFGSSYTLIRVNHEGHHQRNRSDAELAEFILPGERPAFKSGLYYFAILGGIWLGSFAGTLLLPFVPFRQVRSFAVRLVSMDGYNRSFAEFDAKDWQALRWQALLGVCFWVGSVHLFKWDWRLVALAYACFAFSYSSLQWIYHMRTPLDRVEGAYDLRLPAPVRWLFLNFNYNLSHHRRPRAAWQELHAQVDLRETQPLWRRWVSVFRPPEPLPDDLSRLAKTYF